MRIVLRVKPGRIQASALGPILGPTGVNSKAVANDLDMLTKNTVHRKFFALLEIDLNTRKHTVSELVQPDSIILLSLAVGTNITCAAIKQYAEKTSIKTYAKTVDTRYNELCAVAKSCKLNII